MPTDLFALAQDPSSRRNFNREVAAMRLARGYVSAIERPAERLISEAQATSPVEDAVPETDDRRSGRGAGGGKPRKNMSDEDREFILRARANGLTQAAITRQVSALRLARLSLEEHADPRAIARAKVSPAWVSDFLRAQAG